MTSTSTPLTVSLASASDIPRLASITSKAMTSDPAFHLVWQHTAEGEHDRAAAYLLRPWQSETRVTWKVEIDGEIAGYAMWNIPPRKAKTSEGNNEESEHGGVHQDALEAVAQDVKKSGWTPSEGLNLDLFMWKISGQAEYKKRDYDEKRDMMLALCFVDPAYQRRGVGHRLLEWGREKADEMGRDIWLTSTPRGRAFYESAGWVEKDSIIKDLGNYGGNGIYRRSWMVRKPSAIR